MVIHEARRRIPLLHLLLYAAMAVLLVFSAVYYKLRIFSDTAVIITDMIRTGWFATAHSRFIGSFYQVAPLLLSKLNAPLWEILLSYSLNHALIPVLCALLCMHWLHRPYQALAIMLQAVLMSVLLYYYPCSELQAGLFLLLLYDALADEAAAGRHKRSFLIATPLMLPVIVFSHPMMAPTLMTWLAYRLLKSDADFRRTFLVAGIILLVFLIKEFWFTSTYETAKMLTWETIRPFGLNYYSGPLARSWYKYVLDDTFLVPVIFLITLALLWRLRSYRLMGLLVLSCLGILTLVLINFENWNDHLYDQYYEHQLQPIVFFLVLFLSYALYRLRLNQIWVSGAMAIVFLISFLKIEAGKNWHIERQRWLWGYLNLMDEMHIKKAALGRIWIREDLIRGSFWSASTETLLLSASQGPEHAKTLFLAWDPDHINEPVQTGTDFVNDSWYFKLNELPKRYFQLDEKPYVILDHVVPASKLQAMLWP
ncbi:MAG: hypothetical protein JST27_04450 [Bacteroidetes bacterium]|nr:hypothetical protein [Bacteroidota bacterium]